MRLRQIPTLIAGAVALAGLLFLVAAFDADARKSSQLHTSADGLALVKHFEGYYPTRYVDPAGVVTQCYGATGAEMAALPARATEAQCSAQLRASLARTYEEPVRRLFRPGGDLHGLFNYHRFSALVSASYSLGTGVALCAYRSLCAAIKSRSIRGIGDALLLYSRSITGEWLPGLARRRAAERMMLLAQPAPFEMFLRKERRWIVLYDRLRAGRRKPARRAELQVLMRRQARRIAVAARSEIDGWMTNRRRTRHVALARRS